MNAFKPTMQLLRSCLLGSSTAAPAILFTMMLPLGSFPHAFLTAKQVQLKMTLL